MEEITLARTRQLILDIHGPTEKGIGFDTDLAPGLGYSQQEILFVERVLEVIPDRILTKLFANLIVFCELDKGYNPGIVYVPIAKMIFIIDGYGQECNHIFEEDLEAKVAEIKNNAINLAWALSNKNDCNGNNI
jgi:hypothetical protein